MLRTLRNLTVSIMAAFIRDRDARHKFRNKYKIRSKFRKLRDDNRRLFNENKKLIDAITSLQGKIQSSNRDLSITHSLAKMAHKETIDYIKNNIDLSSVSLFNNKLQHLLYCAKKAPTSGMFIECGVFRGSTINCLAENFPEKLIHGFDSFEGLPEDGGGTVWRKGSFNLNGIMPEVRNNVVLHKGLFNPVLRDFLAESGDKVSFLHMDCDIYQSAADVFTCAERYFQCGTIIVFDELFNFVNWQNHEFKAFKEFVIRTCCKYRFISINNSQQCGIEIVELNKESN